MARRNAGKKVKKRRDDFRTMFPFVPRNKDVVLFVNYIVISFKQIVPLSCLFRSQFTVGRMFQGSRGVMRDA